MAHYFPYDVKLGLLADSRSFLANQKARNAIVGAENLLKLNSTRYGVYHLLILYMAKRLLHNAWLLLFKETFTTRGNSIHLKQTFQLNFTLETKLNLIVGKTHLKTTIAYLLLLIVPSYISILSPDVCHQKLLDIVHRDEVKSELNSILQRRVLKQ